MEKDDDEISAGMDYSDDESDDLYLQRTPEDPHLRFPPPGEGGMVLGKISDEESFEETPSSLLGQIFLPFLLGCVFIMWIVYEMLIYWNYYSPQRSDIPLILADDAPVKIVPEEGISVPIVDKQAVENIENIVSKNLDLEEPLVSSLPSEELLSSDNEAKESVAEPDSTSIRGSISAIDVSGHSIQLGSFKDKQQAISTWNKLAIEHDDLLTDFSYRIKEVDIPERGIYYRLQTEAISSRSLADFLCQTFKSRKQDCIVVKSD